MKPTILKFSRISSSLCAAFVLAILLITACDSSKPTPSAPSESEPNFVAKVEVVLNEGDPENKIDHTGATMGGATNFRYKVEITKEYASTDPLGAARAYAVIDADTISASNQDWVYAPGDEHSVFLFAFAAHSSTGNNPAKASVHVQCVWE